MLGKTSSAIGGLTLRDTLLYQLLLHLACGSSVLPITWCHTIACDTLEEVVFAHVLPFTCSYTIALDSLEGDVCLTDLVLVGAKVFPDTRMDSLRVEMAPFVCQLALCQCVKLSVLTRERGDAMLFRHGFSRPVFCCHTAHEVEGVPEAHVGTS